jgi:cell division protein FtsB
VRAKALGEELEAQRAVTRELRGQLQVASAQLSDLERLRADNSALRDEVSELRQCKDDSAALAQLRSEHRLLRLDWELSARRVTELSAEREELIALRGNADQVRILDQEVTELRRRERALEAQIYGLGQTPETEARRSIAPLAAATGTRAAEIEAGIAPLVAAGQRTVVLADHQGFAIATGGELEAQDGLAAFSAVAGDVARSAETLLPVGSVQWVWVIDKNRTQVSCRFFDCGSDSFTLSTLGQAALSIDEFDAVVSTITAKMTQADAATS